MRIGHPIFLERTPEPVINRAVKTLLDLRGSCENTTQEERRDLVPMMIQEVGVDVSAKRVVWVKARPDFDVLFQILDNLRIDEGRRFWIVYPDAEENICGAEEGLGQVGMEVEISFPISHNA